MSFNHRYAVLVLAVACVAVLWAGPETAVAHCDGLDGPVVQAVRQALESGNVNLVLIWVQPDDEALIREAFEKACAVRGLSPDAREMADHYFFETLVRVHRAGEGAPYTGLKPAGRDLGPAIPAADKAVADGNLEPLTQLLVDALHGDLHKHFDAVVAAKNYAPDDVAAGRAYVAAYVTFVHYAEGLYAAIAGAAGSHDAETPAESSGHEHGH